MKCNLCGFQCNLERQQKLGICGIDENLYLAHYGLHFGEEPFLVGQGGSGAIFFAGCNLKCRFCQNFQISRWSKNNQQTTMSQITIEELVEIFYRLQEQGASNINLVSPTPYIFQIKKAISTAKTQGFSLPFVYNTHGYDSVEGIKLLAGLIDLYLPDFKYGSNLLGQKYSQAPQMYDQSKKTIREMYAQVGSLQINKHGLAQKGLIVRHLVLPANIENSLQVLDALEVIDRHLPLSLMSQFHPCDENKEVAFPELNRTLTKEEYERVVAYAEMLGFSNLLTQELTSHQNYLPDFDKDKVF